MIAPIPCCRLRLTLRVARRHVRRSVGWTRRQRTEGVSAAFLDATVRLACGTALPPQIADLVRQYLETPTA